MLEQLAAEHGGEVRVVIREGVLLRIEVIDLAGENFALRAGDFAVIGAPEFPVVAPADFAVSELVMQGGGDLQIRAHFEDTIFGRAGWRDFESLYKTGLVCVEVPEGFVAARP